MTLFVVVVRAKLANNSREQQEIVTLSLLQNRLVLINTIPVERTVEPEGRWKRLRIEDSRP